MEVLHTEIIDTENMDTRLIEAELKIWGNPSVAVTKCQLVELKLD
jgi:hypothetical protein